MTKERPDIIARLRFLPTAEGGRKGPTRPDTFRCPLEYAGEYFDCVLLLGDTGSMNPGQEAMVPIRFLSPQLIVRRLQPGSRFHLWEGRFIAEGEVLEVFGEEPS